MGKVLPAILVVALVQAAPALSEEARPTAAKLTCWQNGIPTEELVSGEAFQVRGTGFKASLPVAICFSGGRCLHSEVDSTGTFIQNRTLTETGKFIVTARQARSLKLDQWILRASGRVLVSEEN